MFHSKFTLSALAFSLSAMSFTSLASPSQIHLRIIETTDLHANIMDFDYYKNAPSEKIGLVRAADMVEKARKEVANSVLVDNGDLIQGSPMGDYLASKGLVPDQVHPAYKAMNLLNYDVGNIGNHEFNYGLQFLAEATNDANFPYINANVFKKDGKTPYFTPYIIKTYQFKDEQDKTHEIKVGYIGFVPPQIMTWDKQNLTGNVVTKDIKEMAQKYIPEMKAQGADVIVAIPHSGISTETYQSGAENSTYYLTEVEGIDAIAFGHAHGVFPSKEFANVKGADIEKGTINGVTAVMPGRWGSHIGVMDLVLEEQEGQWQVVDGQSSARPIFDMANNKAIAARDLRVVEAVKEDHQSTQEFVNQPIGKANDAMYSFLALVQDDPTIQIVNLAQKDYVERFIQGDPDLDGLPVLSAAAPFKVGGRKNDPSGYTEVEAGQLTFRNAADLYLYPNTLVALKVTGKEVKEWLECSAGQFNQIDPNTTEVQSLINWDGFRTYNFDVIDGVNYQIDLTQPSKYDGDCNLVNAQAQRIVELTYNGNEIDEKQIFLIAANNYRAYGGKFAGTGTEFIAFDSPDENRAIVADYISRISKEKGEVTPSADNNWRFAPIATQTKLNIQFETSPSEKAANFITKNAAYPMEKLGQDDVGFALYQIDLSQK